MKVLIVDDEPQVRHALTSMLATESDMTVVAEVGNVEATIGLALLTSPDVVVMDARMGQTDGIQATNMLKTQGFEGSVLIYSADEQ